MPGITIDEPAKVAEAVSGAHNIIDLNAALVFFTEPLQELKLFCQEAGGKGRLYHYLHALESRVRNCLLEFRTYIEHVENGIPDKELRTELCKRIGELVRKNGVFSFTWELRNYIAHSSSLVERIVDNNPCVYRDTLLGWKRDKGEAWRWAAKGYLEKCPDIIDLISVLEESGGLLKAEHLWLMSQLLRKNASDVRLLADIGKGVLSTCHITEGELWEYYIAQVVYDDDGGDVQQVKFDHPTGVRQIRFNMAVVNWESLFDLNSLLEKE